MRKQWIPGPFLYPREKGTEYEAINVLAIASYNFQLLIVDEPGSPHIEKIAADYNGYTLCISSPYDGNDPIQKYIFTITDNTLRTIPWNFTIREEKDRKLYCKKIKESYTNPSCSPFKLQVSSRNRVGSSKPVVRRFRK